MGQASGLSSPCVISSLLEAHQGHLGDEEIQDIGGIGVDIYGGESLSAKVKSGVNDSYS